MTTATDIFIVPTPADRTTLLSAIPRIHFPWELLLPDLQRAGKIRHIGISNVTVAQLDEPLHGRIVERARRRREHLRRQDPRDRARDRRSARLARRQQRRQDHGRAATVDA